ncbi:MAG: hypothetical protein LBU20_01225 [Candidatus Nomurabacteria bacterium]|jgi:hypothetical protein|nr:hypothetical protein [Candidatus Nomurabacteria bacterium]
MTETHWHKILSQFAEENSLKIDDILHDLDSMPCRRAQRVRIGVNGSRPGDKVFTSMGIELTLTKLESADYSYRDWAVTSRIILVKYLDFLVEIFNARTDCRLFMLYTQRRTGHKDYYIVSKDDLGIIRVERLDDCNRPVLSTLKKGQHGVTQQQFKEAIIACDRKVLMQNLEYAVARSEERIKEAKKEITNHRKSLKKSKKLLGLLESK